MAVAVSIVRAYLELNGYFVLSELPVRAFERHQAVDVTDLDILAVRFPHPAVRGGARSRDALAIYRGLDPALQAAETAVDAIVGEVKEGRAALNPGLQQISTVAFALRRLGCCSEDEVRDVAERVLREGRCRMWMAPGLPCNVRLVVFAGSSDHPGDGVHTVHLEHCIAHIEQRMQRAWDLLGGIHFEDPVLGWFALRQKLGVTGR